MLSYIPQLLMNITSKIDQEQDNGECERTVVIKYFLLDILIQCYVDLSSS